MIRRLASQETAMQPAAAAPRPIYRSLYVQVICAIVIGALLGHFAPATGESRYAHGDRTKATGGTIRS